MSAQHTPAPQVHLAVDQQTGTVLAVFAHSEDATTFTKTTNVPKDVKRESRTLFIGQPAHRGYNR